LPKSKLTFLSEIKLKNFSFSVNLIGANAAFLTAENVIDLAMKFYECQSINDLKSRLETDKSKDSNEIGSQFLENFKSIIIILSI
jgi:hypothetical protein